MSLRGGGVRCLCGGGADLSLVDAKWAPQKGKGEFIYVCGPALVLWIVACIKPRNLDTTSFIEILYILCACPGLYREGEY